MPADPFEDPFAWAEAHGIALSRAQQEKLALFVRELLAWQHKMNLVGVSSEDRLIRELLLDSLVPLPAIGQKGRLLDLGSGGGIPAIPLKICRPHLHFQLLEPSHKKAVFLRHAVRMLGLERIEVLCARIEDSGDKLASDGYQVITSRAVTSLPRILQWGGRWLANDGILVTFQGSSWKDVLEESKDGMRQEKLVLSRTIPYRLPGMTGERTVLIFSHS
ncbi:MAG: 16S rRNA (guanine(527)-N(7))-methyltransferase RsmG [Deltaproteobacteria bacterium]